jgi:benzylsuccinate CoA-transferase BbsE subunit
MIGGVMQDRALFGVRVLDLSQLHGYASKLFADLGADVTLVEPPDGIAARRCAPFLGDRRDDNASLHFQYLSVGKKSVVIDFAVECDRALFRTMVRDADIVIDDRLQRDRESESLSYGDVSAINPEIVWCAITPFGQTGPRSNDVGDDMVAMASGGMAWLTGYSDSGPLVVEGDLAVYSSAQYAAVMIMIAYLGREATGGGQFIDVSMQEVIALGTETAPQFLTLKGVERKRLGEDERQAGIGIYPCRDGYVLLYAADSGLGTGWSDVVAWLRECSPDADILSAPDWFDNAFKARANSKAIFRRIFAEFASTRGKQELFEQGQARHIAIAPINDSGQAFNDAHLNACDFFTRIGAIDGTELKGPGAPYHLSATPWSTGLRAPWLGEHTEAARKAMQSTKELA